MRRMSIIDFFLTFLFFVAPCIGRFHGRERTDVNNKINDVVNCSKCISDSCPFLQANKAAVKKITVKHDIIILYSIKCAKSKLN